MTYAELSAHVDALCLQHGVTRRIIEGCKWLAWCEPGIRAIDVQPINSDEDYALTLHEIGHVALCHRPEQPRCWKEVTAWLWAINAAKVWTQEMENLHRHCLRVWGITTAKPHTQ